MIEEMVQNNLRNQWLTELGDYSLATRIRAMDAFLLFPEFSLGVIRQKVDNETLDENIRWRLAFFLGMFGSENDVPVLMKRMHLSETDYVKKIWKGALERIYSRYRIPGEKDIFVSRFTFTPSSLHPEVNNLNGELIYKVVNPDIVSRFFKVSFHVWKNQTPLNIPVSYYWLKGKQETEALIPLTLSAIENGDSVRIDLGIVEMVTGTRLSYQKIMVPVSK
ncbi:MAG: hypothetical protein HQM12_03335 [SAR324 cluster bacterium]|nr:hypothetical protein [SAR324 cluster bacterium]